MTFPGITGDIVVKRPISYSEDSARGPMAILWLDADVSASSPAAVP
jgi:hypothetical protein